LEVARLVRIIAVLAAVVIITLPFGFYRAYTRRMSLRWFLAIHVPVVLVFLARVEAGLGWWFIPFTCAAFAAAQILGARAGRWWIKRKPMRVFAQESKAAQKAALPPRT
jgi:hypothetical protein